VQAGQRIAQGYRAGFDHWLALSLGRMQRMALWGGPGFVDQLEHKLRAYTWNDMARQIVETIKWEGQLN